MSETKVGDDLFSIKNFCAGVSKIMRDTRVEEKENGFNIIKMHMNENPEDSTEEVIGELDEIGLNECLEWYSAKASFNGCGLYDQGNYEVSIKPQDRNRGLPYGYLERELYGVNERGYSMCISGASPYYVFALMCYLGTQKELPSNLDFFVLSRSFRRGEIHTFSDFTEAIHILTAKVVAPEEHSQNELHKIMNSYLFNIAYTKDIAFTMINYNDGDRNGLRRSATRREGRLFPYRVYKNELITYYYQGLSTYIPFTQYLSFYHVAEFFFYSVAEEVAFQKIEDCITRPSFSPYRKEDIRNVYKILNKIMKSQRDEGVWEEREGLLLCLKKYVPDLESLKNTINSIDPTAIDYYKREKAVFADKSETINFDENKDKVYSKIRNRVYEVRNSIVHSKEGEYSRYEPFRHDRALIKEIPLIRAIAEEIILNSSNRLDFLKL